MRAAVESYPTLSSQSSMMRDFNVVMNDFETFDEREVIRLLSEGGFDQRAEILERLRTAVRLNRCLPFDNSIGLFQGLDRALSDSHWDIRRQCINVISEYIPFMRIELDASIGLVLPRLITNIGDSRIVIRRQVIQTLHSYMKHTNDMPLLMRYYVQYGLENSDARVRKESVVSLPVLITSDFASEDFTELIASLCKKLVDRNEDETIQQVALVTLNKLRTSSGDPKFKSYLMKLQPQLRDYYCQLADFPLDPVAGSPTLQYYSNGTSSARSTSQSELYFGVVPAHIKAQLSDDNFRNRGQAVEQLKLIMESLHTINPLMPHVKEFLNMLNDLLEDNNFKIITVTLDIMGILVEKTSQEIRPHLKPVLQTLTKRMGDNKNVIRQAITKVIIQLMQILGPKLVLLLLCDNLSHRSPRVRTEAINCIINSLLTFPSYEFDLPSLCSSMAYCLLDNKRAVRHACLECFAVLAQCLGAGKLQPLMSAVETLEQSYGSDSEGAVSAVQARLTRRMLPRRNEDNLIEYAVQLPSLNSSRNGSLGQQGPDVDWILAGSGAGGNSARSMRLEDLESTSRQSSASLDGRRYLSAGKKPKLPWDENQSPKGGDSPVKPKQMWAEEPPADGSRRAAIKQSRRGDDLLLASVSYSGSPESSNVDMTPNNLADVESSLNKPPFSKSGRSPKPELSSTRPVKHNQKEGSDLSQSNKSFSGKPILNPLPVSEGNAPLLNTWGYSTSTTPTKEPPPSNIPIKASQINRKSGTKKPGKVPPIPKSQSPLTIDNDVLVDNNGNELPQLNASLNKIRNSASKKKAEKLFEKLEKQESETEFNTSSSKSPAAARVDNPFEARPKLARHNSQTKSRSYSEIAAEKIPGVQPLSQSKTADIRLAKSESLSSKIKQSKSAGAVGAGASGGGSVGGDGEEMVAVVGRGYSDDPIETPPKLASVKNKRRSQKAGTGSSLSPLGLAASSAPGMIPLDDDADLVSVVGRGMFEGDVKVKNEPANSITSRSTSISKSSSGYGTLHDQPSSETGADSDEELDILQMSQGLRDVAAKKKKERQEESAAKRRAQQQREEALRAAEEEKRQLEQEQVAERRRKQLEVAEKRRKDLEQKRREEMNTELDPGLRIAGSSPMKSGSVLEGSERKQAHSPVPSSAGSHSVSSDDSLRPFSRPSVAYKEALRLTNDSDWSNKMAGINKLRALAQFHPDVVHGSQHSATLILIREIKNLRTKVARLAIVCLGDFFTSLKKAMDPELEACAKTLLPKNAEANEFIRTELDRTLGAMISETTPQRCLTAVIMHGAQHKNPIVRKVAVQHMVTLCETLRAGKLLSGVKDITDKILPAIASLAVDPSPETRWYARKILLLMLQHPEFESMLAKHTSPTDARDVLQVVDTLRTKGLGKMPSDAPSATGTRRSGTFNRGSRTNSAESTESQASSVKQRRSFGPMQAAEDTVPLLENMGSANWNARHDSITELVDMVQNKPKIVSAQSIKIFDKYAMLLKDSNSKVAIHALDSLHGILSEVRHDISGSSINLLIQNTAAGLASKNKEIYEKSSTLLDSFINNIDHTILFQPFVQVAMNATARTKPDIVDRVCYLSKKVYKLKQKAVILHALPLAWHLVKSIASTGSSPTLKDSVGDFLSELYDLMGDSLYDHAASAPGSSPQLVDRVKEMINRKGS